MKIIKRDGSEVPFDYRKIKSAIEAANADVAEADRLSDTEVGFIVGRIEKRCDALNRSVHVEEIQDMVIEELEASEHYRLALHYSEYRLRHELLRRQNSTDAKILSLLRHDNELAKQENANKDPIINSTMRDYLASEVSEDICRRYIFPEDVMNAHDEGIIHVHDMGYVSGPISNCELVNLEDMLQNGTVITDTLIEKPHSFSTACNIATQIIAQVASNTYGGQTISLAHLAPFVDVSRQKYKREIEAEFLAIDRDYTADEINRMAEMRVRKEVQRGIQTIQYQIQTLLTTNGQTPFVSVFMYLDEVEPGQTRDDLALIIAETLKQRYEGIKNEVGVWVSPAFPKLIYVLDEDNITEDAPYWYLTELAARCTAKRMVPDYISAKVMKQLKGDVYTCMGVRISELPSVASAFTDDSLVLNHGSETSRITVEALLESYLGGAGYVTEDYLSRAGFITEAYLSEYVTASDLAGYVTGSDLDSRLADYVAVAEIDSYLSEYLTASDLDSRLNDYVTSSDLEQSGFITGDSIGDYLSEYVTDSQLSDAVSDFITLSYLSEYVSSAVSDFVTQSYLSEALGSYVTSTYLSEALGYYLSSSDLDSYLSDYVSSAYLSDALSPYLSEADISPYLSEGLAGLSNFMTEDDLSAKSRSSTTARCPCTASTATIPPSSPLKPSRRQWQ